MFSYITLYWSRKYVITHNFRLDDANDFKLGHKQYINETNVSWKFGENPTMWRHVTAYGGYAVFLPEFAGFFVYNFQKM